MIRSSDDFHKDALVLLLDDDLPQEALNLVRQGLRHFPNDLALKLIEAMALGSLGHYPLARDVLEALRRNELAHEMILPELIEVYLNLGRKKDAIQCAREALHRDDCDDEEALYIAELFDEHGLNFETARSAARAIRLNPNNAEGWFRLGCAVWASGQVRAAEFCCRKALVKIPEFWMATTMLAMICFDERRFEEAKALWGSVPLKEHRDSASLVRWRSLLRSSDPRTKEIRRRWREIRVEERPHPPHPLLPGS